MSEDKKIKADDLYTSETETPETGTPETEAPEVETPGTDTSDVSDTDEGKESSSAGERETDEGKESSSAGEGETDDLRKKMLESEVSDKRGFKGVVKELWKNNKPACFSAVFILLVLLAAIFAPIVAPYGYAEQDLVNRLQAPSAAHLLGTDDLGRDILSRLIYGARLSLMIGVLPTVLSMSIGIVMGLIAGYYGGLADKIIIQVCDVILAFPSLLLAMVVMYTLGSSIFNVFVALSIIGWASVARVVRSETLSLKESEYVEAARSIGVKDRTIMFRHILPNCVPSLIVLFTLRVPGAILSESSLSFLGIGAQPPTASWGLMVNSGRSFLFTQPWISLSPAVAIMLLVLAFNFLGDGLRDILDPYMKV